MSEPISDRKKNRPTNQNANEIFLLCFRNFDFGSFEHGRTAIVSGLAASEFARLLRHVHRNGFVAL